MTTSGALPLLLRIAAVALAALGVIDPRLQWSETVPAAVDLRIVSDHDDTAGADAARSAVDRLQRSVGEKVAFNTGAAPAARVLVGGVSTIDPLPIADVSVSTIAVGKPSSPNVRIVAADSPAAAPLGWSARIDATIEAVGMSGRKSVVVLEQQGVALARTEYAWRSDRERTQVEMFYAAPVTGVSRVSLRVLPAEGEAITLDNKVDLRLETVARQLQVLVHEPRPSWATAFVRRALEQSAVFDVAASTGASRGLAVRAGAPPSRLTAGALEAFDLVVAGAPEELTRGEVDALRSFARVRGGAVILVPDRRPSGPYVDLLPTARFEEVLVENPLPLRSPQPGSVRGSEIAIPREVGAGRVIASVGQKAAEEPVIVEWTAGAGRVIFAGALDAWRFRAADSDGYARFWEALAATASVASPRKIEVSIDPPIARPGESVAVRARLRRTELIETATRTRTAPLEARIMGADGSTTPIRMWPTADVGVFEGRIVAPAEGRYDVQVASEQTTADDVLITAADVRHAAGTLDSSADVAGAIAMSTGGVAVGAEDLAPLERLLASLPQGVTTRAIHPVRSMLYVTAFAALLCAEWTLRRRRGLR
ncbi:MAG TPA: hypothetical protein VFJ02_16740 [Vicinamibacterales bacterium]|nr:hypothetical protein [Vicinamibacterales bacterium]